MIRIRNCIIMASSTLFLMGAGAAPMPEGAGRSAFVKGDYAEAAKIWEPLAAEGNPEAASGLAGLRRLGLGVEKNAAKAMDLYRVAAKAGLPEAQVSLGLMLLKGEGTPAPDPEEAATWVRRAAEQGDPMGQYNLALLYENGLGVASSRDEARLWLKRAADQGHERAIARLKTFEAEAEPEPAKIAAKASAPAPGEGKPGMTVRRLDADAKTPPAKEPPVKAPPAVAYEGAGLAAPKAPEKPAAPSASMAESPAEEEELLKLAKKPVQPEEPAKAEAPKAEAPKAEAPKPEPVKTTVAAARVKARPADGALSAYEAGDFARALTLWSERSAKGDLEAMFRLGRMANRGEGGPIDRAAAYMLWRAAAEAGHQGAATALANLTGRLDPQDLASLETAFKTHQQER